MKADFCTIKERLWLRGARGQAYSPLVLSQRSRYRLLLSDGTRLLSLQSYDKSGSTGPALRGSGRCPDSDLRWWCSRFLWAGPDPGPWLLSCAPRSPAETPTNTNFTFIFTSQHKTAKITTKTQTIKIQICQIITFMTSYYKLWK